MRRWRRDDVLLVGLDSREKACDTQLDVSALHGHYGCCSLTTSDESAADPDKDGASVNSVLLSRDVGAEEKGVPAP